MNLADRKFLHLKITPTRHHISNECVLDKISHHYQQNQNFESWRHLTFFFYLSFKYSRPDGRVRLHKIVPKFSEFAKNMCTIVYSNTFS